MGGSEAGRWIRSATAAELEAAHRELMVLTKLGTRMVACFGYMSDNNYIESDYQCEALQFLKRVEEDLCSLILGPPPGVHHYQPALVFEGVTDRLELLGKVAAIRNMIETGNDSNLTEGRETRQRLTDWAEEVWNRYYGLGYLISKRLRQA